MRQDQQWVSPILPSRTTANQIYPPAFCATGSALDLASLSSNRIVVLDYPKLFIWQDHHYVASGPSTTQYPFALPWLSRGGIIIPFPQVFLRTRRPHRFPSACHVAGSAFSFPPPVCSKRWASTLPPTALSFWQEHHSVSPALSTTDLLPSTPLTWRDCHCHSPRDLSSEKIIRFLLAFCAA